MWCTRTMHLGIAFSFAVGDGQCALDPEAMTLPLQQGIVAQGALLSGLLAEKGFTGAREFLLGRFGYLVAYEPNPRLNYLSEGLGKEFYGEQIAIKPFASCRATHPSIELALNLRKQASDRTRVDPRHHRVDQSGSASAGRLASRIQDPAGLGP